MLISSIKHLSVIHFKAPTWLCPITLFFLALRGLASYTSYDRTRIVKRDSSMTKAFRYNAHLGNHVSKTNHSHVRKHYTCWMHVNLGHQKRLSHIDAPNRHSKTNILHMSERRIGETGLPALALFYAKRIEIRLPTAVISENLVNNCWDDFKLQCS